MNHLIVEDLDVETWTDIVVLIRKKYGPMGTVGHFLFIFPNVDIFNKSGKKLQFPWLPFVLQDAPMHGLGIFYFYLNPLSDATIDG
jgi:hypothetical protein